MTEAFRFTALARLHESDWKAAIASAATVLFLVLFGALFHGAANGAFQVWVVSPAFNHCFLVLPLSLFMIWQRRSTLVGAGVVPDMRATFVMLGLSVAWLITSLASILEVEQFVVVTMVQAALFGVLGLPFYKRLAAPFLYLYFLVPSGTELIPALQAFTAQFAVLGLHVLGIPVFSTGAVIEIPAGTFAVAEACAGLRFLIAAVAFGVFFAVVTYRSWLRRTAFIAVSIVVPVIANGFRALGLIAAAQWVGSPTAVLADHIIYGWIFFSLVLVMLVIIGQLFSDRRDHDDALPSVPIHPVAHANLAPRIALVALACFLAAAAGPATDSFLVAPRMLLVPQSAPRVALPWRKARAAPGWRPVILGPTRSFLDTFVDGPYRIDRFIALNGVQGGGNSVVRADNRAANEQLWSFDSANYGTLSLNGHAVPVRVTTWLKGTEKRIVWTFYVVNGRAVSSLWSAKLNQLYASLTDSKCVPAYVALSTEVADESAGARAAARLLAATEPLGSYLCGPMITQTPR